MDNRHYEKFADGRIKDIEDELPFAVPEGWAWCRLGDVCSTIMGQSPESSFISNNSDGMEFHQGKIHFTEKYIQKANNYTFSITKIAPKNAILLCVRAPVGVVNITEREICIGRGLCSIYPKYQIQSEFWFYWLQWQKDTFEQKATGTTFQAISIELIKNILIPLPPLSEQHHIVIAIEAMFTQIALLEQNKVDLQTVVKQAKSKILDLAIHGKLVPQDPADEPASVMLERLRAEKEAKIAAGEIKCRKNDSYIYKNSTDNCYYQKFTDGYEADISDEIPFDVPDGWAWCRLGEIYYHTTGKALKKSNEKGSLKKYITTSNLYWDTFDLSEVRTMYFTDDELDKYTIKKGDLVLCNGGDVGRAAIWSYDKDICYQNHISRMRPKTNGIENRFFLYVLKFYKEQNMLKGKGIGISSLSASDLLSVIIPLPSLFEQQRIVAKIEELFAKLDFITAVLTE
ncbi:restriction endonuclease subunit S [Treponema vincentii]|uniref:restriction endonuclease subunit S n=1 Tax=Treponema vincentii TaxID=69710 RepID=UPI003D8D22D9